MSTEERREVKKKLRREVLARRAALTEPERERGNLLITERILGHQWYYLSDTILGFVSYGNEICTTEILENGLPSQSLRPGMGALGAGKGHGGVRRQRLHRHFR